MCRESCIGVMPVQVVISSISDVMQLVAAQTEQVRSYLPEHEKAARAALMEALETASLLREQLAAVQESLAMPKSRMGTSLTFFDGKE